MEKEWYVVNTYSGHENKVKEKLEMRASSMGMEDYIFRIVVPSQKEVVVKNGKETEKDTKMFPGYILVEMVMTDEAWFVVRNTPNVTGFVGSHGNRSKPTPLFEEEIQEILQGMGKVVREITFDIHVGNRVKFIDGAFSGFEGPITEVNGDKVKVTVDMFGRETPVELDALQVKQLN